jgi:hypothetical protein
MMYIMLISLWFIVLFDIIFTVVHVMNLKH